MFLCEHLQQEEKLYVQIVHVYNYTYMWCMWVLTIYRFKKTTRKNLFLTY